MLWTALRRKAAYLPRLIQDTNRRKAEKEGTP
jgi:hypothetical protein